MKDLSQDELNERERRRVEARLAKDGRIRRKMESGLGSNMTVDAQIVRLTPAQEEARKANLAERMEARRKRIALSQLAGFKSVAESVGAEQTAEEATRLMLRAELEQKATGGAFKFLKTKLVLSWKWLANQAMSFLKSMHEFLPYIVVKRFALRSGLAAALVLGGGLTYTLHNPDGSVRASGTMDLNGITTAGLNHILDTEFHAGTQVTTWYFGLINGGTTPTLAAADTMSSHAGWTEYTTYSQTNRVAWDEGAASAGAMTNSVTSDFSMNGSGTVAGGFLTSSSTKSGTTGTLFMTASFSGGNQTVSNGDTLKLTYTLSTTAS